MVTLRGEALRREGTEPGGDGGSAEACGAPGGATGTSTGTARGQCGTRLDALASDHTRPSRRRHRAETAFIQRAVGSHCKVLSQGRGAM